MKCDFVRSVFNKIEWRPRHIFQKLISTCDEMTNICKVSKLTDEMAIERKCGLMVYDLV
jgi:protein gp37